VLAKDATAVVVVGTTVEEVTEPAEVLDVFEVVGAREWLVGSTWMVVPSLVVEMGELGDGDTGIGVVGTVVTDDWVPDDRVPDDCVLDVGSTTTVVVGVRTVLVEGVVSVVDVVTVEGVVSVVDVVTVEGVVSVVDVVTVVVFGGTGVTPTAMPPALDCTSVPLAG
jgi:hypothetical protein